MATLMVPTITRTMASDSEFGDASKDGSDVFDTVTQLEMKQVRCYHRGSPIKVAYFCLRRLLGFHKKLF